MKFKFARRILLEFIAIIIHVINNALADTKIFVATSRNLPTSAKLFLVFQHARKMIKFTA